MAIGTSNIKLMQSERLTDNPDGGGRMTANEVVDGVINNLFPDISSLNLTTGRVNLRKAFAAVFTPSNDTYYGAGLIITNPPTNEQVITLVFDTDDHFDERSNSRNYVENYRVQGPESRWILYGDHIQGQAILRLYSLPEAEGFDIGEVLALSIESDSFTDFKQYVRISEIISRAPQTFVDAEGAFRRDVMQVRIDQALLEDFPGIDAVRVTDPERDTFVRTTSILDAARYFGVKEVQTDVTTGDLTIKVDNPYSNIVPATQAETPIVGEKAGLGREVYVQSGDPINIFSNRSPSTSGADDYFYTTMPALPGTLSLDHSGTAYVDDEKGNIIRSSDSEQTGLIDYTSGQMTFFQGGPINGGQLDCTFTPAAVTTPAPQTEQIPISDQTRALNYIRRLDPIPAPGTLTVDYRSFNQWYRLTERGDGTISGDAAGEGSGSIDFGTGDVTVTLGALPDPDTIIIFTWATNIDISRIDGDIEIDKPQVVHQLAHEGIEPGTVQIDWLSGGNPYQLTDDGDGNLIDGSLNVKGRIIYGTGETAFTPDNIPDPTSDISYTYDYGATIQENYQPAPDGNDVVTFTLNTAPVRAGSVVLKWVAELAYDEYFLTRAALVMDDGSGGFVYATPGPTGFSQGDAVVGASINYTTGEIVMPTRIAYKTPNPTLGTRACQPLYTAYSGKPWNLAYISQWTVTESTFAFASGGTITAYYKEDSVVDQSEVETIDAPPVKLDLTPLLGEPIVPKSVRFTFNGKTYVDRSGSLYHSVDVSNNSGTLAGTIDYVEGECTITDYAAGANTIDVHSGAAVYRQQPVSFMAFRTPGAPVRQASMTISALFYDNSQTVQATSDVNGQFSDVGIEGAVEQTYGFVEIAFGQRVQAAGNESEWWYNPDAIDSNGDIWKPQTVFPGSVEFSAVIFKYLPIDSQILGLDPVRLPQDGRVPIFRPGDVAVVHRSTSTDDANPSAGSSVDLSLDNVKWLRVRDANDNEIPDSKYTLDEVNGVLTWATPLDLSGYTTPITIDAMAYFQRLISDVTINGVISINAQASQDFVADGNTYVSSKLIFSPQDMQARYTNLFGQQTWTGEWSDSLIGNGTVGQYDDVNYPIETTNDGAETERWRIEFTNSTTVNVIGEHIGQVLTAVSIANTIAPINPATGNPYFTIEPDGWGGGWATGNQLRFNTISATHPVWFARTILAGESEENLTDEFVAMIQGDAD